MTPIVIDCIHIKFIYDDELDELTTPRKLDILAKHDGAIIDPGIYKYIQPIEFPDLFFEMFEEAGWAGKLELSRMFVHRRQIDFCFRNIWKNEEEFRIGIELDGTSGEFQVYEGDGRYVNVSWTDGRVATATRTINGVEQEIALPD